MSWKEGIIEMLKSVKEITECFTLSQDELKDIEEVKSELDNLFK